MWLIPSIAILLSLMGCLGQTTVEKTSPLYIEHRNVPGVREFVERNGGYIYPYLQAKETVDQGWTTAFTADAPSIPNNMLIKIPFHLVICNTTSNRASIEALLLDYLFANKTFFKPFFDSWPREMDLLWHWSNEELRELENEYLMNEALERRQKKIENYNRIRRKTGYRLSFTDYQLVDFWMESRAFNVDDWYCVVPFADLPNHDSASPLTTWGWEVDGNGNRFFVMQTEASPKRGAEFKICYVENMSNEVALKDYGYCDIDAKHQHIDVTFSQNLTEVELRQKQVQKIVLGHMVNVYWIMRFYRTFVANAEELRYAKLDAMVTLNREIEAAQACSSHLRELRPRSRLLHREFRYLYDRSLSSRSRNALAYKIAYDRLFERTAEFCERWAKFLKCTPAHKVHKMWHKSFSTYPRAFDGFSKVGYLGGREALCWA